MAYSVAYAHEQFALNMLGLQIRNKLMGTICAAPAPPPRAARHPPRVRWPRLSTTRCPLSGAQTASACGYPPARWRRSPPAGS